MTGRFRGLWPLLWSGKAHAFSLLFVALCLATLPSLSTPRATFAGQTDLSSTVSQNVSALATKLNGQRFTETRAHARQTGPNEAATVAEAAARARAMQSAMRVIVTLPEVRIAGTIGSANVPTPNLLALAHASVKTTVLLVSHSKKNSTVTITVAITENDAAPALENRIRDALVRPNRLALYEEAALREAALIAEYDSFFPTSSNGKQETAANYPLAEEATAKLAAISNELKALAMYATTLPLLEETWENPAAVRVNMEKALALTPNFALARNALGDAWLQLGRSQEAMEEQTRAIKAYPTFARAYHSRGSAALVLGLLSSAAADFSEAIRLAPTIAAFYRDRGLARHLMGETAAMCHDFYKACALGECDKLQWAANGGLCTERTPK